MSIKQTPAILQASKKIGVTKADLKNAIIVLEATVAEGYMDGVDCLVIAKQMEELAKGIRASYAITEQASADIANGRNTAMGATLKEVGRSTYSYKDSPLWVGLNSQIAELSAQRKAVEEQAKHLKGATVNTDTGEIEILPAKITGGSTAINVTLSS